MTSASVDRRLGLTGSQAIKTPCDCATTAAITLSGEQTIDSVTTSGSRVLVKNQSDATTNGIYLSDTGTWTRDLDFDGTEDARCGTLVFVTGGSSNGAGLFQLTTANPVTIGSSSLSFTKIATLAASSVTQINVQNGQFWECTSIAGTNTITGTTSGTAPAALGHGQFVFFLPANTSTGAATFNRDSLGAKNIFYNGIALVSGELVANVPALLFYDGTQYNLVNSAAAAVTVQKVQNQSFTYLTSVSGTNTIVGTATPTPAAYAAGQIFYFVPSNTNTGAATLNASSLGAKNVFAGGIALVGGEIVQNVPIALIYDGTQFNILGGTGAYPLTWAPTLTFATPGDLSVAYTTQAGYYIKTGRQVTIWCDVLTSNFTQTTASGDLRITGLPFTPSSTQPSTGGPCVWSGITKANFTNISATIMGNSTIIGFTASGSAQGFSTVKAADTPTGGTVLLRFQATFFV